VTLLFNDLVRIVLRQPYPLQRNSVFIYYTALTLGLHWSLHRNCLSVWLSHASDFLEAESHRNL